MRPRGKTRRSRPSSSSWIKRRETRSSWRKPIRTLVETQAPLEGPRGGYRLTQPVFVPPDPGHGPGGAGGAHRSSRARGQALAADCRGHRQGRASRVAPGDHPDRARPGDAGGAGRGCRQRSSCTRCSGISRGLSTRSSTRSPTRSRTGASCRSVVASCTRGSSRQSRRPTGSGWVSRSSGLAHHALRGELREKAVGYLRQAGGEGGVAIGAPGRPGLVRAGAGGSSRRCPRARPRSSRASRSASSCVGRWCPAR